MRNMRISLLLLLIVFVMQSCVLEERIHFREDLSGTYEMSFAMESMDENDKESGLSDDFVFSIDSLAKEIGSIDGVEFIHQEISDNGFSWSMNFENIEALNTINAKGEDQKAVGRFENIDDRLTFSMETDLDSKDKASENGNDKLNLEDQQWFKHRVIITFDKKMKRLKHDGFKKIDKKTLVYDSEKITNRKNISFSIKNK